METMHDGVRDDVCAQLASDQRLPYPDEIAVDYDGVAVTLRGTVGSFAQLRAAVADARRTPGVEVVFDELQVRVLDVDRRGDAEIRGAALQRLVSDAELWDVYVDVSVNDAWVTLKGEVDHQYQSHAVFDPHRVAEGDHRRHQGDQGHRAPAAVIALSDGSPRAALPVRQLARHRRRGSPPCSAPYFVRDPCLRVVALAFVFPVRIPRGAGSWSGSWPPAPCWAPGPDSASPRQLKGTS